MTRFRLSLVLAAVLALAVATTLASAGRVNGVVLVQKKQPVQVAVVLDNATWIADAFAPGIRNAITMAVAGRTIKGFPIEVNESSLPTPCFGDDAAALNAAVARAVVRQQQNVAVIGHLCSASFGGLGVDGGGACTTASSGSSALATYERAGVVTLSGSTTSSCLPSVGPTVFNGMAVSDPGDDTVFGPWYSTVQGLTSDVAWSEVYEAMFGVPPTPFADLYYDATNLLLARLEAVSKIKNGKLVIDRAELAAAVRGTTNACGVTGTISLDSDGYRVNAAPAAC